MSSRRSSQKSIVSKSSRVSQQQNSGWNLNPENGLSDIYLNYQENQLDKQSSSPNPTPDTPHSNDSPSINPLQKSQSSSISNQSPVLQSFSGYSNQSPMLLSNLSFKTEQYDFFRLNKIKSEADETEYQYQRCFKKFKTQSLLPNQMTEAELRMQNRHWNKMKNDYLKKIEDQKMLEIKMQFIQAKNKINQLSLQKSQRKKIHHVKGNQVYTSKAGDQPPLRSLSLPVIKSKIIDLGTMQAIPSQKQQLRDSIQVQLSKISKMSTSQTKLKKQSLAQKCSCKPLKVKNKNQKDINNDYQTVQQIQLLLRKNGVNFDVNNLKKGLIQSAKSQQLKSFPSKSLISNPIYRKWGI